MSSIVNTLTNKEFGGSGEILYSKLKLPFSYTPIIKNWSRVSDYLTSRMPVYPGDDILYGTQITGYDDNDDSVDDEWDLSIVTLDISKYNECFVLLKGIYGDIRERTHIFFSEKDDETSFISLQDYGKSGLGQNKGIPQNFRINQSATLQYPINGLFGLSTFRLDFLQTSAWYSWNLQILPIPIIGNYLKVGFRFVPTGVGIDQVCVTNIGEVGIFLR